MITITNNASTLLIEYGSPYNRKYVEQKANLSLHFRPGSDYIDIVLKEPHSRHRPEELSIDWNKVTSPATASPLDLFTLLYGYINVPIDNIRVGTIPVAIGANTVTFSSPMSSASYTTILWSSTGAGVVISAGSETVNGFTIDSLDVGFCTYYSILA